MTVDLWGKTPIVDADTIIYSASFACQEGRGDEAVAEESSHAFHNAKKIVTGMFEKFNVEANGWRLFLGGKDNFRKSIARVQPYKGKRPPKPLLYEEVRNYLVTYWQAEIIDGMEAEDMAAIVYNEDPEENCLCAVDKDVLQVPGLHFNYNKGTTQVISPREGNLRLWAQILTGDSTDSITGIPGCGPVKANKLLQGVTTYRQGWRVAVEAYKDAFLHQRCFQKEKDGKLKWMYEKGSGLQCHDGTVIDYMEALVETGNLIYLLRSEGDSFKVLN